MINPTSAASVRPIPRNTRRTLRQGEEGGFRAFVTVAIVISSNMSQYLFCGQRRLPIGHAASVLAGLSSIAQVQDCVVGRSGGQQESAPTTVLCVWVAPPQLQQGASTLSMS